jgi:hypothetical protein
MAAFFIIDELAESKPADAFSVFLLYLHDNSLSVFDRCRTDKVL